MIESDKLRICVIDTAGCTVEEMFNWETRRGRWADASLEGFK